MRHLAALAILSLLWLARTGTAHAGQFQVQPTTVALAGKHTTGSVAVTNRSANATRFQVKVARWDESERGETVLAPTDELVVYPSLFTLAPGESRAIRIAGTVPPGTSERSYRVFVEELPPLTSAVGADGVHVRVLTRMGIPVFLRPVDPQIDGAVEATLAGAELTVRLHNAGTAHARTRSIRVVGLRASGTVDFDRSQAGWYLLAGGSRVYQMRLGLTECLPLDRVRVEVGTDDGTWATSIAVTPAQCRGAQ